VGPARSDDGLDVDGLLERCENEISLAIAVIESFYTQGSICCTQIMQSLEAGQRNKLLLNAVYYSVNISCASVKI
jgi:hypothetical protein